MKIHQPIRRVLASAVVAAMLVACSDPTPEEHLASAKAYLAKKEDKAAVIELRNALQQNPDLAEARFLLGKALFDTGDIAGAEKELRSALELQYPAEQVVPLFARTLVLLGQYGRVVSELARVELPTSQGKAELMTAVGQSYLALGNSGAASSAFALAIAAEPKHVPALLGQAQLAAQAANLPQALATVESALVIAPSDPEAWVLKGDLLQAQKKPDAALVAFRKAVEVKPDFTAAHGAIVSLLVREKKLDEASKQMEVLKQVAPRHPQTLYLQAQLAYLTKDFAAARPPIQQLLRVMPDSVRILVLAAAIELELKSYAQAEDFASKALQRAPQLNLARRILVSTYLRNGQPGKALDTMKPVLDRLGDDPSMLALAGEVLMVNGEPARAAEYFAKASALDPSDVRKRTAVALTHLATGESEKGFRELEQAAAADSGDRSDLALIAALVQRREYDKALVAIAALEKKNPSSPVPHNLRGGALVSKHDPAGARQSFERALQLNPAYFPAAANLAQLDLADKNPEAAKRRFESILAKDGSNAQALLALAALRMRAAISAANPGAPIQVDPEVVALIKKAIAAQPTDPTPRLALMRYYVTANDAKEAAAAAQDALAVFPDRPEVLDEAGRAYQAGGDPFQALAAYKKLASLQPSSVQPYLRMAEVQVGAKNKDDAMESLRKALEIRPNLIDAQRGMIALDLDAGRVPEALARAREIQKQRPKESIGFALEGDIQVSQKKWNEAVGAYREGLTRAPSTDVASRLYSSLAASDPNEASRFAATWLKDHPKDAAFRLYFAQDAGARQNYTVAAQQYRTVLELQPNNAVILNNLAWVESQLKDPKAIEHAEQANKIAPDQPAIMDTLGMLLVDKGDTARGLALMQKASSMAPQVPAIRMNLAKALVKAGQKDAARKELDELSKLGDKFSGQAEVAQLRRGL